MTATSSSIVRASRSSSSGGTRSTKCSRTPWTCVGRASRRRARPASVSSAKDPRASDGHETRPTYPADSSRSTSRVTPLRLRPGGAV